MKKILISLINLYQKMPLASHKSCRFIPTCSNYAKESINTYGAFRGSIMAIKRILKCNPLGPSGYDPVPLKKEKKMKNFKYFILTLLFVVTACFFTTGCTNDSMDNIEIIVTNYPTEYITKKLYEDHATITSIYPDGVDIANYKISNKQKNDYAKKDLFVYNGLLEKERNLALDLLDINPNLKIIDTAYVLETDYSPEELWLNPSSLLMMGQNVRIGLQEYITSTYLRNEVDERYNDLKIELSELDVEFRIAFDSTDNNTIIVADSALVYLEKFGLEVICIDSDASQKTLSDAENLISNRTVSYIYGFKNQKFGDNAQKLLDTYPDVKAVELHKLDNISDEERRDKKDYIMITSDNLEFIKREIYQ